MFIGFNQFPNFLESLVATLVAMETKNPNTSCSTQDFFPPTITKRTVLM